MLHLTDTEHQMLMLIYHLAQGDWRKVLMRKEVSAGMGMSAAAGEEVLKSLTKHGLIRYVIIGALSITKQGISEVALRSMPPNPSRKP